MDLWLIRPVSMLLMRAIPFLGQVGVGWALEISTFWVPNGTSLAARCQGSKKSRFPGPNPLPLGLLIYLPASKALRTGRINHRSIHTVASSASSLQTGFPWERGAVLQCAGTVRGTARNRGHVPGHTQLWAPKIQGKLQSQRSCPLKAPKMYGKVKIPALSPCAGTINFWSLQTVLWIRDILTQIQICGSITLTYWSGSGS